uniref:Late embryogenesis abundant protein LEA-2 subgroup domain-containing protein n=1 Tax=Oryza nivara TaxID=4536 RepID=A0A0E0HLJ9_ORYNI
MMHAKSESDVTSLAPSSPPRSPKRGGGVGVGGANYYVQSPSRESHDGGYKSSSMQATPVYNSPNESPSHPSYGRHSRSSSVSRFSGTLRDGSRKAGGERKALNDKGWPECNVIEEEGPYEDLAGDTGLSRRCQIVLGFLCFVLLFTVFCLIIWGAARPYEPDVVVKSLTMDDFYAGEGTDHSGVPTKLVTLNCSLHIAVYNPASMFGIHVTTGPIRLLYSEISIGVGQPRKSHRLVTAVVHGNKVPLYGAGGGLMLSSSGGAVPLTLDFDLTSRGYVIGKLVRVTHKVHVTCPIVVDAKKTKPIKFSKKACAVYKI